MGVTCYLTSSEHIAFSTSANYLYYSQVTAGAEVKTSSASFHDAFDAAGTQDNCMLRVRIWK